MNLGDGIQSGVDWIFDTLERAQPIAEKWARAPSLPPMTSQRPSPQAQPQLWGGGQHMPGNFGGRLMQADFDPLGPFYDTQEDRSSGQLFRPTQAGWRPRSLIIAANPATGKPTFFKNAGTPILFSGDLSAARRVSRVARRAKRGRR